MKAFPFSTHKNHISLNLPIWLVLPLLGLVLVFGVGSGFAMHYLVAPIADSPDSSCPLSASACEEFAIFWEVWQITDEHFVDAEALNYPTMTEGAINGMLNSLGDEGHTRFLSAEAAQQWDESLSGEFEGIGAYLDIVEGQSIVVLPIEGSPAEKAGLQAGDLIMEVDGHETRGWTIEELVSRIRGPQGSTVTLTVQHEDEKELVDIAIKRDTIEVPSVRWAMLPNDVALIQLDSFQQRAAEEIEQALIEAKAEGAHMLILDLRNNQGGFVHEAIGVASQFLPEDTTVLLEEDRSGETTARKAYAGGEALDIPMVVLINFYTASSAEIVSGALQDMERAQLVGERTVGTGTVLTTYTLEDGSKLLLGTMQWLTPDGRLIRKEGIMPDVEVELPAGVSGLLPTEASKLSAEELRQSDDVQLVKAFELLNELSPQDR